MVESEVSEPDICSDDMGAGLNLETPEEIERIQNEAQAKDSQPQPVEPTTNKKKGREVSAPVWAHFKKGEKQEDGSYTATCIYCGHVYDMGNQKGTGNMTNHIARGCKKVPPAKRRKRDALQKLLQAGIDAVQDGLEVLSNEITKIRETMKYIRHSQKRMKKFRLASSQVNAPNKKPAWDVETRWNFTYLMLDLALQLNEAINRYALSDSSFSCCPTDVDWENVEAMVCHLKVFYDVTNKLSGTKYPTLNLFFPEYSEVYLTIIKMSTSAYPFIVDMSKQIFKKWEKYWKTSNVLLAVACFLDPRCKLHVVEYYLKEVHPEECPRFMANLKACMNQLFKEYSDTYSNRNQSQTNTSTANLRSTSSSSSSAITDTRAGLKNFLSGMETAEPTKTELEEYISDALDDTSVDADFDILAWWKLKTPKYPIMAKLTRDILAVPISTVASESTFSTTGRTLSLIRSSLNDESLEALICAQDWLKASVAETGGVFGDVLCSSDEGIPTDDTICDFAGVGDET
ncbi:hypothetical protein LUZ63_015130 [Rhynchospora breviuscula]|uniref:BED-type domain-containing protein n=1 Tax=Rhynchospora breviuscula TaxID=2022672 RepID=A0A9Q0HMG0_9POAL|nr:hypothetical protein LUZ63_015130 [Rhynchospora breviuscula]